MATLIENTVVVHPETGEPTLLAATGELPDWAVGLVGDHLLDRAGRPPKQNDEKARLLARIAELEAAAEQSRGSDTKVPPRSGPGSGAPEWRAYARSVGVDVDDNASRDDVVAALDAADKPITK
jgi:hypothetical protein